MSANTSTLAALRQDPHYQRFVQALAAMVWDGMERDGTLPEHWRRRREAREAARRREAAEG